MKCVENVTFAPKFPALLAGKLSRFLFNSLKSCNLYDKVIYIWAILSLGSFKLPPTLYAPKSIIIYASPRVIDGVVVALELSLNTPFN